MNKKSPFRKMAEGVLKRPCSLKGKAAEKLRIRGVRGLSCYDRAL